MLTVAERVAKGAKMLDEHQPGWVDGIDLECLWMSSPCECILGQTFRVDASGKPLNEPRGGRNGFSYALEEGLPFDAGNINHAADCGFTNYLDDFDGIWTRLRTEWKRVIEERRLGDEDRRANANGN